MKEFDSLTAERELRPFTLRADSLASKWGFGDGDQLDDYLNNDLDLFVTWKESDDEGSVKWVQHQLIVKFLLPLLPGVEIHFHDSLHNASRVNGDCTHLVENSEVSVDVDVNYILEYIKPYTEQITPYAEL